jgi:hypothetical protein
MRGVQLASENRGGEFSCRRDRFRIRLKRCGGLWDISPYMLLMEFSFLESR